MRNPEDANIPDVHVAAVCRESGETVAALGQEVCRRAEAAADSAVVLYGPAPGAATEDTFVRLIDELCSGLQGRMRGLAEAQDAAARLREHHEEQQRELRQRQLQLQEAEDAAAAEAAAAAPRPPPAKGTKQGPSSRQPRRASLSGAAADAVPADRKGSSRPPRQPAAFRDAVRRASEVAEPEQRAALARAAAARAPDAALTSGLSALGAGGDASLAKVVLRATERAGVTELRAKEGHHGRVACLDFDGGLSHLEIKGLRGLGRDIGRFGVEFWARTTCEDRKMTILQLLGHKMETVHVMYNQDLNYEVAAGHVYIRVKDQLFNELEIHVDSNDIVTDGRWHHIKWQVEDLQEDRTHFTLDGVPQRVHVGAHTCPYKFDNWGEPGEDFEGFGGIGTDWKALRGEAHTKPSPFRGQLAEFTLWGGDRVLHYWPLTQRTNLPDDPVMLQDVQSGTVAEMKDDMSWRVTEWPKTSLFFDGTNYINCGSVGSFGSQLGEGVSIDIWFTTKVTERPMSILHVTDSKHKHQSVQISINVDEHGTPVSGAITLKVRDADGQELSAAIHPETPFCDGAWHHIVWSLIDVQNNAMRVDVDGRQRELRMGLRQGPSRWIDFSSWLCLGGHNNHGTGVESLFIGSAKALKIWEGKGRDRMLLAYLRLDEGPGATIALDSAGNGHNGVLCRLPASELAPDAAQLGRRASVGSGQQSGLGSSGLKRRASLQLLRNALDASCRHFSWLPVPQPAVDDRDVDEERQRRKLLVKAHDIMGPSGQEDISLRVAHLEVTGGETGGEWGERVIDCLHGGAQVALNPPPADRSASAADADCIPAACFADASPASVEGLLLRGREARGRGGHQIVCLWLGTVRVFVLQLVMRSAAFRASVDRRRGRVEWSGPLSLAGAEARKKHVLFRGVAAVEAFLCHTGAPPPAVAHSGGRALRGRLRELGGVSVLTRCLEHVLMRRPHAAADLLLCLHAADRPQLLTAMQLCDCFDEGARKVAAALVQKVWRGVLERRRTEERRLDRDRRERRRRRDRKVALAQSVAANSEWALMQVYFRRLLKYRNLALLQR